MLYLTRKLKDNGSTTIETKTDNPWQEKIYQSTISKKIVDLFIPKEGTKERRKMKNLMKDAATKDKIQWIYERRILLTITIFIGSLLIFAYLHKIAINYIYTEPTSEYDLVGEMSGKTLKKAEELTRVITNS